MISIEMLVCSTECMQVGISNETIINMILEHKFIRKSILLQSGEITGENPLKDFEKELIEACLEDLALVETMLWVCAGPYAEISRIFRNLKEPVATRYNAAITSARSPVAQTPSLLRFFCPFPLKKKPKFQSTSTTRESYPTTFTPSEATFSKILKFFAQKRMKPATR